MTRTWKQGDVIEWLHDRHVPIADLEPFRALLAHTRIIGLGDPTHGTREFYQFRARLLRFLIATLNCRALAVECSASGAEAIDEFIAGGSGELSTLVTQLRSAMWDVEEFTDVLLWLRQHNQTVPEHDRVTFIGLDIWNTAPARHNVLEYLEIVCADDIAWVAALFEILDESDTQGIAAAGSVLPDSALPASRRLVGLFAAWRDRWILLTGEARYAQARRHSDLILKWVLANKSELAPEELPADIPPTQALNGRFRSSCMARNLVDLLTTLPNTAKVVIWAHSYHISPAVPNLGSLLRQQWGAQYSALLFECAQGKYLARSANLDKTLGDYLAVDIPAPPESSLPWHLAQVAQAPYLVTLRTPAGVPPGIEAWLREPRCVHAMGWGCAEPPHLYLQLPLECYCDGIIFFANTTPTTPTRGARSAVAQRWTY